jgi:hypothetical protein
MTETLWLLRFKSVFADGGMGNYTLLQEYARTTKITFENKIIITTEPCVIFSAMAL